ncbi:arylamine N-acetyltransferase [Dehalobacter sp. DCM]|uniref:arylamine N-acetyltransferase family protein n=1 Tax=Dehalobacter sp. DCM TaxID=2907827 RepID=UPI0030817E5F|nr:arylamine N-acetyltransferase [Dehalobacter sp. DCM]
MDQFLTDYFKRINYTGSTDVSSETLYGLHTCHTLNVPFENLDVYNQKPIFLDKESLYKKIVHNKRGGYCFEMNGLFSFVLKELGFKVTDLLARVHYGDTFGPKVHQALLVEIQDEKWLVDVGFGRDGIIAPLLIQVGIDQQQFTQTYRLLTDPEFGFVLQIKIGDNYCPMYAFKPEACYPVDFMVSSHFTSTSPTSIFVIKMFCTKPTPEGRITLVGDTLKVTTNGQVFESTIENEAEYHRLLKEYFALDSDNVDVSKMFLAE